MKTAKNFLLILLTVGSVSAISAQRIVTIPPGVNTIVEAIAGDTTETGERFDTNTVYELERNGVYKHQFEIINPGFPLHVRAAEGDGAMPIMQPTPFEGGEINRAFTVANDLTVEGIYLSNYADNGNFDTRIIRATGPGVKVVVRNCWFDGSGQSAIRFDSPNATVIMEDCIISHIGRPANTGNGRVIDIRGDGGIGADTVIIRNNTFYNITRRITRFNNGLGAAYINVDHNTFVNSVVQFIHLEQSLNINVTNNLLINPGFEGEARGGGVEVFEINEFDQDSLYLASGYGSDRRTFISNNWIYYDPIIEDVWADSVNVADVYADGFYEDITLQDGSQLEGDTAQAQVLLNSEPYLFRGPIQFANAPRPNLSVVVGTVRDARTIDNRDLGQAPAWNYVLSPWFRVFDGSLTFPWDFPYDFSYDINSPAATASTTGGPLGDPRWAPRDIEIVVGKIEDQSNSYIYPNPFKDFVNLVGEKEVISMIVYSLSGNKVAEFEIKFNSRVTLQNLKSGTYVARVNYADGSIENHKITKR